MKSMNSKIGLAVDFGAKRETLKSRGPCEKTIAFGAKVNCFAYPYSCRLSYLYSYGCCYTGPGYHTALKSSGPTSLFLFDYCFLSHP